MKATTAKMASFIADVQSMEWNRLQSAIDNAVNHSWSIAASHCALTIVEAARLVGPTPWNEVPWALVRGHVYTTVLTAAGIEHNAPTEADEDRLDDLMYERALTGQRAVERYRATVAAIREPRETHLLREGEE